MERPNVLQFIIEKDEMGGYSAHAIKYAIHTQGETLDETVKNIHEAVHCHFDDEGIVSPFSNQIPIMINFESTIK